MAAPNPSSPPAAVDNETIRLTMLAAVPTSSETDATAPVVATRELLLDRATVMATLHKHLESFVANLIPVRLDDVVEVAVRLVEDATVRELVPWLGEEKRSLAKTILSEYLLPEVFTTFRNVSSELYREVSHDISVHIGRVEQRIDRMVALLKDTSFNDIKSAFEESVEEMKAAKKKHSCCAWVCCCPCLSVAACFRNLVAAVKKRKAAKKAKSEAAAAAAAAGAKGEENPPQPQV